jgi:hypothetical protein
MRRDFREELIAWTIGLLSLAAAAALLTGCAAAYPTEASDGFSPVEMALVDQTARWAGQLGVRVRGEITNRMHPGLASVNPTAWYEAGVAYYYRPNVERLVRLVPTPGCETAANVAAHEVAHAIYYAHDISHWCCAIHMGATPTYSPSVAGAVCEGRATRCLTR